MPRLAYYAAERPTPPSGTAHTAEELPLWLEILRAAKPVPPRTHLHGLKVYARFHGLSVEDLEQDKAVLVVGDQVAARGQLPGLGFLGHSWSLLVPVLLDGKPTEPVLEKRFQNVEAHDEEVIAWGSWENCTDSIAPLVTEALTAIPAALSSLWQISLALRLEYRFLPALPEAPAKKLAEQLGAELAAAADRLTVESDARLLRFALGRHCTTPELTDENCWTFPLGALLGCPSVDALSDPARHLRRLSVSRWRHGANRRSKAPGSTRRPESAAVI